MINSICPWISVTDKLPEPGVGVLITDGKIVTAAARAQPFLGLDKIFWEGHGFGGDEWEWDFSNEKITHWMPLPEPPKK